MQTYEIQEATVTEKLASAAEAWHAATGTQRWEWACASRT